MKGLGGIAPPPLCMLKTPWSSTSSLLSDALFDPNNYLLSPESACSKTCTLLKGRDKAATDE